MDSFDHMKRGTVISVNHPRIFEPVLTVIQKMEGNNMYFKVPVEFLKSNVFKGDSVTCQILKDEYEYVLKGMISDIDINYPNYVQMCVDKTERFRNKRETRRYMVNFLANVIPPDHSQGIYAVIKNIGLSGVGAVFKEDIILNSTVKMKVLAQVGKKECLEFGAVVTRAIPKGFYNEYGLKITELDEKNKDLLDKIIYQLCENEDLYVLDSLR